MLFTSWAGGCIAKYLLGLQQTCILLNDLVCIPWLVPNSEGVLIERLDFSGGEESFEICVVHPDAAFPESWEFHLAY